MTVEYADKSGLHGLSLFLTNFAEGYFSFESYSSSTYLFNLTQAESIIKNDGLSRLIN